jgi:hypothetical protein
LVARFGDAILLVAEPDQYPEGTERLVQAVESAATASVSPGAAIAVGLGSIIVSGETGTVPPFGVVAPAGDAYVLLLHGPIWAQIVGPDGVERLRGEQAITWVDRLLEPSLDQLKVSSGDHPVSVDPRSDLRAGLVPGSGFVLTPAADRRAGPASGARDEAPKAGTSLASAAPAEETASAGAATAGDGPESARAEAGTASDGPKSARTEAGATSDGAGASSDGAEHGGAEPGTTSAETGTASAETEGEPVGPELTAPEAAAPGPSASDAGTSGPEFSEAVVSELPTVAPGASGASGGRWGEVERVADPVPTALAAIDDSVAADASVVAADGERSEADGAHSEPDGARSQAPAVAADPARSEYLGTIEPAATIEPGAEGGPGADDATQSDEMVSEGAPVAGSAADDMPAQPAAMGTRTAGMATLETEAAGGPAAASAAGNAAGGQSAAVAATTAAPASISAAPASVSSAWEVLAPRATEAIVRPIGDLVGTDGARIPLDRSYVIGREPEADPIVMNGTATPVRLGDDDNLISRVQCYITVQGGQVALKDASSANGTFVAAPGDQAWTRLGADAVLLPPTWSMRVGNRVFTYVAAAAWS